MPEPTNNYKNYTVILLDISWLNDESGKEILLFSKEKGSLNILHCQKAVEYDGDTV